MNILVCYGTRPEWIKVKPLIEEMRRSKVEFSVLYATQHESLLKVEDIFFDLKLELKELSSNRLNSVLASIMSSSINLDKFTHVLVQGDTTTALGLAIYAFHNQKWVIHLEAGLRTFDKDNPYPEEINRRLISEIADIHLCPTSWNVKNLHEEGIEGNVFLVGNTLFDSIKHLKNKISYNNQILVTLHRRENHEVIKEWFTAIESLAQEFKDLEFIFPIHPNPNVLKHRNILKNVKAIDPISHEDLIEILTKCKLVISDSGGIQEECSFFKKKVIVCRKTTERSEVLSISSFLCPNPQNLRTTFLDLNKNFRVFEEISPFGSGYSSQKIVQVLKSVYG